MTTCSCVCVPVLSPLSPAVSLDGSGWHISPLTLWPAVPVRLSSSLPLSFQRSLEGRGLGQREAVVAVFPQLPLKRDTRRKVKPTWFGSSLPGPPWLLP